MKLYGQSGTMWTVIIGAWLIAALVMGFRLATFFAFLAVWIDIVYPEFVLRREQRRSTFQS